MRLPRTLPDAILARSPGSARRRRRAGAAFVLVALAAAAIWQLNQHTRQREAGGRQVGALRSAAGPANPQPVGGEAPIGAAPASAPRGRPVNVSVDVAPPAAAVPSGFLGLSFQAPA